MASLVLLSVQARGTRGCRGHYGSNIEYGVLIDRDGLGPTFMSTSQNWFDKLCLSTEGARNLTYCTSLYTNGFRNYGPHACLSTMALMVASKSSFGGR